MKWYGASQRKAVSSRLATDGKDVRGVKVYLHTFILVEGGRADEREQPFFTACAPSPEEAEALAFSVYQNAIDCPHELLTKQPGLAECRLCGVQRRVPLAPAQPRAQLLGRGKGKAKAKSRFLGLF